MLGSWVRAPGGSQERNFKGFPLEFFCIQRGESPYYNELGERISLLSLPRKY
ncbi:hypothetical protein POREN0001_1084 [Porphyromonas endodontalis ATCC 35406]|uniref:Uncharacterized protein n=1 Tax=Porphyromonas endodontalis (strain ATCC 35406 / DSM 24491 / JCM 8526 / CCUG 16442 / BCRC 14492 / NCTC 13058 / HG 370) TaxID=553175 RepID=C3J9E0_POREA|nr:hypothetical protein POREN0001_1084 [Porphyromonas endodontalis ATCC 35406]